MRLIPLVAICIFYMTAVSEGGIQSRPQPAVETQRTPSTEVPPDAAEAYIIGPEDVLAINVWHEPELTTDKIAVRPDGKVGMPLLNDIQAGGLTPKQLQEEITQGLKTFVADPNVSVLVVEARSHVVHIIGSIGRPGAYILGAPLTVVELLARAGGLTEFAKSENIQVVRDEKGKISRYIFNYKKFIEGTNFSRNIQLRSGDVVTVP